MRTIRTKNSQDRTSGIRAVRVARFLLPVSLRRLISGFIVRIRRQLVVEMVRTGNHPLASIEIPAGYRARPFQQGMEHDFIQVIRSSLRAKADMGWFRANVRLGPHPDSDNISIIYKEEYAVAAACARGRQEDGKPVGLIHSVGVDPDYQGLALGRAVSLLALRHLERLGYEEIRLKTDFERTPAVRLYLSLGFRPRIRTRLDRIKWFFLQKNVRKSQKRRVPSTRR